MSNQDQQQPDLGQQHPEISPQEVEKREEAKLKAKFAVPASGQGRLAAGGHSAFLQKRLAKGQKFFDSGDYQMAKQKGGNVPKGSKAPGPSVFSAATGEAIPTPDTVPMRKTSIIQPSKLTSSSS